MGLVNNKIFVVDVGVSIVEANLFGYFQPGNTTVYPISIVFEGKLLYFQLIITDSKIIIILIIIIFYNDNIYTILYVL